MVYKNLFEELKYKFKDLSTMKPDKVKSRIRLFDSVFTDEFVYNMSPSKYIFYKEFEKQLQDDPELLKNIIYENNLIKASREAEAQIVEKLVSRLNRLSKNSSLINKTGNIYIDAKKQLIESENKKLVDRLSNIINTYDEAPSNAKTILEETLKGGGGLDTGPQQYGGIVIGPEQYGGPQQNDSPLQYDGSQQYDGPYNNPQQPQTQPQPAVTVNIGNLPTQANAQTQNKKTPEKYAFDSLSKDIEELYENKIQSDKATHADIELLQNYMQNLGAIAKTWKAKQKQNLNDATIENLKDADIISLRNKIKSYINDIINKLVKPIESAKDDLKKQIEEKTEEITKTKELNDTNFKAKGIEKAKNIKDDFKKDPNNHLHSFKDQLEKILNNNDSDSIKASKLADVVDEIDNNEFTSIDALKLSRSDRLVFIGITFIVRMICLVMIDWALNTNYIVSFTQAYILYVILYCIFIMIIIAIVNMTYMHPYHNLYRGNHSLFTNIAGSLYYFYLIPGNFFSNSIRFVIHFMLIIFLTLIAIFIKANESTDDNILNYDYSERKRIRRVLSNFTILLWFFTSVIAMYMF